MPCAPVNGIADVLADPQMQHLGVIDVAEESEIGTMPRIRPPVAFDGAVLPPVGRAPYLGEHTDAVLESAREADPRQASQ